MLFSTRLSDCKINPLTKCIFVVVVVVVDHFKISDKLLCNAHVIASCEIEVIFVVMDVRNRFVVMFMLQVIKRSANLRTLLSLALTFVFGSLYPLALRRSARWPHETTFYYLVICFFGNQMQTAARVCVV